MTSRWFNVAVVGFWLATMGWLVQEKILPALVVGDPPSYRTVVGGGAAGRKDDALAPIGWRIQWNGQPLGWAIGRTLAITNGGHELRSRVRLRDVPMTAMTPNWMGSFMRLIQRASDLPELLFEVDAVSTLGIDPLGRPIGLSSLATLGYAPPGLRRPIESFNIRMEGIVEGNSLKLTVRSGELVHTAKIYLPVDSLMGDALSPQSLLPNLRVGQTWTVPIYSPFRPPNSPMEVLQAKVERGALIVWEGAEVSTLVVVYTSDTGSGLSNATAPRGRCWVAHDGRVLRQEFALAQATVSFERVGVTAPADDDAAKPADVTELRPWWTVDHTSSYRRKRRHDQDTEKTPDFE